MADIIDFKLAAIEDEASNWVAKVDRGLSEAETQAFQSWLMSDKIHYDMFMQMAEFWDITEQFALLSESAKRKYMTPNEKPKPRKNTYTKMTAIAASIVLVAGGIVFSYLLKQDREKVIFASQFSSGTEVLTEILPDNSTLTLNAGSTVAVEFSKGERKLFLRSGELFVEVQSDQDRPLSVHANGRFFKAVGTAFLVSLKSTDTVEMLVSEGRVAYGLETKDKAEEATAIAGQKVESKGDQFVLDEVSESDIDLFMGWRTGTLVFKDEPLSQVVKRLEKYYGKSIIVSNQKLAQEKVTGRFEISSENGALVSFADAFDLDIKEFDNFYKLSERR